MGLHVSDHTTFQQREWKAQRAGWVLMALLLIAALLGLLGPGPLSWSTATAAEGLVRVDYQRFAHTEADDLLTVTIAPGTTSGGSVDVELRPGDADRVTRLR